MTYTVLLAQSPSAPVETIAGVHTARFETAHGAIRVHVASDARRGDTVSGTIVAEPIGSTPEARKVNLDELNGFAVAWQGQRTPVSTGRYEWMVPDALRDGTGALLLEDRAGRPVARAAVPIDPIQTSPGPPGPADAPAVPRERAIGETVVIRARSDGRFGGRSLRIGGTEAQLLASSPRQHAFRVPAMNPGAVPFRFTSSEPAVEGTIRVVDITVSASQTQLLRGQRATLTMTVRGLSGITAPVTLTVVNASPAAIRVDNIERPIEISPRQVQGGGTFVVTRRMTAGQPGPFHILASVGAPPTTQFDVSRTTSNVLAEWQAQTGVGVTAGASELIRRSVLEARLDGFLGLQRAHQGDPQEVFAALLSDYLFDLRDDVVPPRRAARPLGGEIVRVSLRLLQDRPGAATITEREVRRSSFTDYLSGLTERFTARQAAGYLFVRSVTPQAPITVNGRQKGDRTDRRFVTPVGDHQIVVNGAKTCRQLVTVVAFQTRVVEC